MTNTANLGNKITESILGKCSGIALLSRSSALVTVGVSDGCGIFGDVNAQIRCPSSVLKFTPAARCGVGNRLKMLMYWRVHCAFSPISALPGIHRSEFQQTASYARYAFKHHL